eukprot:COSAG01_NODE_1801_length_9200_cov_13.641358_3_plen_81_part_00
MRGSSVNPKAEILQMGYDPDKGADGANNHFKQNALVEDLVWEGATEPAGKTANYALVPAKLIERTCKTRHCADSESRRTY